MTLKHHKTGPIPFDAKYPNAWRGDNTILLRVGKTDLRLKWMYRTHENDWRHVDYAKRVNISPKWLRGFSFVTYYAGHHRYMWHLTMWRVCLSYIPLDYPTAPFPL